MATTSKPLTGDTTLTNEQAVMAGGLLMLAAPLLAVLLSLVIVGPRAWVFSLLWGWFVLPLFPGAPALGWGAAFGVMWTYGMLRLEVTTSRTDPNLKKGIWTLIGEGWAITALSLFVGWVLHVVFPLGR